MTDIQQRIALILRGQGLNDEFLVDKTRSDRLAEVLVAKLGLTPDYLEKSDGTYIHYVTKWEHA